MIAIKRKRSSNSVAQRMVRCPAEFLSDAEEIGVIIADVDFAMQTPSGADSTQEEQMVLTAKFPKSENKMGSSAESDELPGGADAPAGSDDSATHRP